MREIKFRAWGVAEDCDEWEIQYSFDIISSDGEIFERGSARPEWVLMQFTGLLDKQGKEIYEGDIVEFKYANIKKLKRAVIEWGSSGFWVVGWWNKIADYKGFEVIGNIYENPELLEVK